MATEFTKGRWIVEIGSDHTSVGTMTNGVFYPHARLIEDETYDSAIDVAEAQANARLIAAAPRLLKALNAIVERYSELMGRDCDRHDFACCVSSAENVIAEAQNGR